MTFTKRPLGVSRLFHAVAMFEDAGVTDQQELENFEGPAGQLPNKALGQYRKSNGPEVFKAAVLVYTDDILQARVGFASWHPGLCYIALKRRDTS